MTHAQEDRDDEDFNEEPTHPSEIESYLIEILAGWDRLESVETFEDRGVLTRDHGVVIRMGDGAEFQITIVQSRRAR